MSKFKPDKSKFKTSGGNYIVQGLFLEDSYNTEMAVYTLAGEDKLYNGKTYPSLKRLYLVHGDPEEYSFAVEYLNDWGHWQRMCKNKTLLPHITLWREELNLSLRSEAIAALIGLAKSGSYQAAKYLADEGWVKQSRGRPSKAAIEKAAKERADLEAKFEDGSKLLMEKEFRAH